MTTEPSVSDAWIEQLAIRLVGPIRQVERLTGSQHVVCRVVDVSGVAYVFKVHTAENSVAGNFESTAYECLSAHPTLRRCVARGQSEFGSYLVLEWVEGATLLARVRAGDCDADHVAARLVAFFTHCRTVSTTGFGMLDGDRRGAAASWPAQLTAIVERFAGSARALRSVAAAETVAPILARACEALRRGLATQSGYFASVRSCLVPVDLNLDNFLIAPDGRFVVLDLGAFWGADSLLALGEWAGHTWGTPLYAAVGRAWGTRTAAEELAVRFYALLSNVSVMTFIARTRPENARTATPWGNPQALVQLIDEHAAVLERA